MAVKTPLKWVGSKVRLMPQLRDHLPKGKRLVEPFAGSCAVMMNTDYDEYLIADLNPDLVNLYKAMAYHTDAFLVELETLFSAGALGEQESQTVTTGKDLIEKIGQIRKSVAAVQQQIIAPVVWIGSGTINVAQLMLDTLDVVKELAEQTASHTHSNTGTPINADAIKGMGTQADILAGKYSPVIGK